MIYFKNNGKEIEKYEVLFDREALLSLRQRIIKNCGEVHKMHEELKESSIPKYESRIYDHPDSSKLDSKNVKIIHYEDVKYRLSENKGTEWDHYYEYEVDLYYCDYTMYICPYLVYFIDGILIGKEENISALFNRDKSFVKRFLTVEEKIKYLENELFSLQNDYIESRRKKLEELNSRYKSFNERNSSISENYLELQEIIEKIQNELLNMENNNKEKVDEINDELSKYYSIRKYNTEQKSSQTYFDKLLSMVEFRLVDKLNVSEIDRINEFFNDEIIEKEKVLLLR